MANIRTTPGGALHLREQLYRDEGDGTHSEDRSALLRAWNATTLAYQRVEIDNATGGIKVSTHSGSDTATVTSVADSASNVTLLAANTGRFGATVFNDSTVVLYLKLGATASTSSFTTKVDPGGYYEVPFGYTGIIDGIWASDASGSARITELT